MTKSDSSIPSRLAGAFSALMRGEALFWSEGSTDYYKPFQAIFPDTVELDADSFRESAGIGRRYHITIESGDRYFHDALDPDRGAAAESLEAYAILKLMMEATLRDLRVVRVGQGQVVQVRFFVFGRSHLGYLVGLRARCIET